MDTNQWCVAMGKAVVNRGMSQDGACQMIQNRLETDPLLYIRRCDAHYDLTWQEYLECLEDRYNTSKNKRDLRDVFNDAKQGTDELGRFMDKLGRLRSQAYHGESRELKNEEIVRHFINNLLSRRLKTEMRKKYCHEEGAHPEDVLKYAFSMAHALGLEDKDRPREDNARRPFESANNRTNNLEKDLCHYCMQHGHFIRDCPKKKTQMSAAAYGGQEKRISVITDYVPGGKVCKGWSGSVAGSDDEDSDNEWDDRNRKRRYYQEPNIETDLGRRACHAICLVQRIEEIQLMDRANDRVDRTKDRQMIWCWDCGEIGHIRSNCLSERYKGKGLFMPHRYRLAALGKDENTPFTNNSESDRTMLMETLLEIMGDIKKQGDWKTETPCFFCGGGDHAAGPNCPEIDIELKKRIKTKLTGGTKPGVANGDVPTMNPRRYDVRTPFNSNGGKGSNYTRPENMRLHLIEEDRSDLVVGETSQGRGTKN